MGCRHGAAVWCLRRDLRGLPDPERVGKGGGGQVKGEQTGDQLAGEERRGIVGRCDPDQRSWRKRGIAERERKRRGRREERRGGERERGGGREQ